jgi:hypothetical protein
MPPADAHYGAPDLIGGERMKRLSILVLLALALIGAVDAVRADDVLDLAIGLNSVQSE